MFEHIWWEFALQFDCKTIRWAQPCIETHFIVNIFELFFNPGPLLFMALAQWNCKFILTIRIIDSFLHIDRKPSITLIQVNPSNSNSKHERIRANLIKTWILLLYSFRFGINTYLIKSRQDCIGEND